MIRFGGIWMRRPLDRETAVRHLDGATSVLSVCAVVMAVFLLLLRLLVHFPIIDEINNAHYLWLVSEGLKPGPDFFCTYPVLFYLLLAPAFGWFPESAFVLLGLRLLSVALFVLVGYLLYRHGRRLTGDWLAALAAAVLLASSTRVGPFLVEFSVDHAAAVLAVAAMTLMFRPPTGRGAAAAAALCLLSAAVTPKYVYGLFFGLVGYATADYLHSRNALKTLGGIALGGATAGALVLAFYWGHGLSLSTNVRTAFILTAKLATNRENLDFNLGSTVLAGLFLNPLFGALVLLGVAGWLRRSWRRADNVTLAGAGILFGTVLFCVRTAAWYEQYQTVAYLSLAVFAPFALSWVRGGLPGRVLRCVLAAALIAALAVRFPAVAREFSVTNVSSRESASKAAVMGPPAVSSLAFTDFILRMVPREERVVAVWIHHPIFRRDLTPVSTDDRPSLSTFMAADDPSRALFDPGFFKAELERRPPALIDLNQTGENYPPGWTEVARDFLIRKQALYEPIRSEIIPSFNFFIRKDLLPESRAD